jgi:amino acid adenylation domain-containing protein
MENMNMSESKERTLAAGQNIKERDYWLEKLSGPLVKTTFPRDSRKADEKNTAVVTFKFVDPVYAGLLRISNKSDVRLHIILVAGWLMLLHRYTGAGDIIVGTPTYRQDVEGRLINTALALRNTVTGEMTVKELLLQVGQTVLQADENQNYPIETLIYKLNLAEADGDFPLFDISILLEELHDKSCLDHIRQNLVVSFCKSTASLEGVMEYNANLYSEAGVQRIVGHFCRLLENALMDVNVPVSQLDMLSERERDQLLNDFNNNAAEFPRDKSIYRFVEDRARQTPGAAAVSFEGRSRTYDRLNRDANRLARVLTANGVRSDHTVGILMDRGPAMVECILAVWKAGGAYIPLDRDYPPQRLTGILNDSDTGVVFAGTHILDPQLYKKLKENYSGIIVDVTTNGAPLENLEEDRGEPGHENPDLEVPMSGLAYVIYTSGSTGKPKGAMVEHMGMMNHIQCKIDLLGITETSAAAQNASHTFDISVWQFFAALTAGGKTVIYPGALVLDPVKLIHRLDEDGVTILEVVPSYLAVMLGAEAAHDDVCLGGSLEYLLVTGEEIKPHLVCRWFEMHPGIPMVNAYGPTEASDDITHHVMKCAPDPGLERIPIGKPVQNLRIYIVDQYMKLCPIGAAGEIWVSGVGVGRGYLKDEERTAGAFMDDPFAGEPGTRLYKTGDLGRWSADGTIEFLGRVDYQVKIRGFRIELGEIENCLVRHSLVKGAVVTDREDAEGNKYLCAYILGNDAFKKDSGIETLKGYLGRILPDYMVPAHFVVLEQFPLTANGKIDRKALPAPEIRVSDIPYISREELKQWQGEYEAGGFQGPAAVDQEGKKPHRRIDPAEEVPGLYKKLEQYPGPPGKTYYPLSYSQKMLYFNEKILPGKAFNNLFFTVKYPVVLDPGLLRQAVNRALLKNPGLRLRIVELDLGPSIEAAQYVAEHTDYQLESVDFSSRDNDKDPVPGLEKWLWEKLEEPFPLIDSALFYFAYIKYSAQESGYCLKCHHIACDGWTFYRFFAEIHHIYRELQKGESPDETPNPSYIQHLLEERDYLTSPQFEKDRVFWHDNMLPLPQAADISLKEGSVFDIEIKGSRIMVPGELCRRMPAYSEKHRTSIYRLFLSALSIYVSRAAGVRDFVIGSVKHSRSTPAKRQMAGMLIDFFPFRVKIDPALGFGEFVEKNGQDFRDLIKNHGRYPFYILLTELKEITGIDPAYLNNVSIVDHPTPGKEGEYTFHHHPNHYSFDPLTLHVFYTGETEKELGIELLWEYRAARFCHTHIASIHRSLLTILTDVLENPGKPLSAVDILSEEDQRLILHTFNNTAAEFPADKTLYRLFEEQVTRAPANTAVRVEDFPGSLTYGELNEKANRLARHLRSRGVGTGSIAAMLVKRSFEMIIGILAVMKAGGAYLPIGLTDPENRIAYMCRDCGAELLLTDNTRELPDKAGVSIMVDVTDGGLYRGDGINLPLVNTSLDPAAVFYTSGSTGKPKGVIVEHRGLVNRLWWLNRLFQLEETDVFLQQTPVTFDVSVWELLGWSFRGASVYFLAPSRGDKTGDIVEAAIKGGVTYMHIPPAFQLAALDYIETRDKLGDMGRLKQVIASGEALLPVHVNAFNRLLYRGGGTRLFNLYGPTEASIEVAYFDCSSDADVQKVPIGRPIDNVHLYIVDENMNLVPMGVPGHLCIAGTAVARGYVNQPLLTAEKFDQDLWDYRDDKKENYQKFLRGGPGGAVFSKSAPPGRRRQKLYKTGDLARWLPDGNIEFLGRIDNQVQLDGFRIEPGEIESLLLKHKTVKEAAVVPWKDEKNGRLTLCAFLVAAGDFSPSALKMVLLSELPQFMIPSRVIELERMPVNSSGKIDRKILETLIPESQPGKTTLETEIARDEENIPLSEEEENKILYTFNNTEAEYPADKTIYQLFEEQTARTPGKTAIVGSWRGKVPRADITYSDFNEESNRLARVLRARGVTANSIVGIMTERTVEMMIGIMAIIKAGGAYLAISLTYPDKRIEFMCRDSGVQLILTDNTRPLSGRVGPSLDIINEEYHGEDPANPELVNTPGDAAAVFYTSGSTGTPKGVLVEHRGMVNRMHWMQRRYPLDETDVILQKTAVIFDVSVWELFWWSFYGASVYLLPPGQGDKPQDIVDAVKNGGVTRMHFIPTPMAAFLHHVEETGQVRELASLKRVFASGEALAPALVNHFNRLLYRGNGTRLSNLYGPTEASIDVSYFDCPGGTDLEKIPIGKPIDNIQLYIVGRGLELLPIGAAGELCIGGVGLARGYLNRPGLTTEKFCLRRPGGLFSRKPPPWTPRKSFSLEGNPESGSTFTNDKCLMTNDRFYFTGDLARWLPDGNIEFLGRIDHQVQVNGIRIEVEEIERALLAHQDIKEAVVVPGGDESGEPYLCAFVKAGRDLAHSDFRQALAGELPLYMVPARFIELETLPLTPTGKVDRKLLKLIDREMKSERQVQYTAPKTELETQIADIWKEVLNTDKVGIHDNFFDLGGNSLGIIQVNFKLKAAFKREIPVLIMFEYSTIASMVRYLEGNPDHDPAGEVSPVEEQPHDRLEVKTRGRNRMQQRRTKIKKEQGQEE